MCLIIPQKHATMHSYDRAIIYQSVKDKQIHFKGCNLYMFVGMDDMLTLMYG